MASSGNASAGGSGAGRLILACLAAAVVLPGCPKKITEQVVQQVQTPCPPVPEAPPQPSVHEMITVAVVAAAGDEPPSLGVVAAKNFAAVVGVGDTIGLEQATVLQVAADGITIRLPDTTSIRVKLGSTLPGANAGPDGTPPVVHSDEELLVLAELERWRLAIINFITHRFGF